MWRTLLAVACICVPIVASDFTPDPSHYCAVIHGKKFFTFGDEMVKVNVPCKYNALRDTVCGDWRIQLTPTVALGPKRILYYHESLFLAVQNVRSGLQWEGRTSVGIAKGYTEKKRKASFEKLDGRLNTEDVFISGSGELYVSLMEKKGQFKIQFVYGNETKRTRFSGFVFECSDHNLQRAPYPTQLCGTEARRELVQYSIKNHGTMNLSATLLYNIFTDPELIQEDANCRGTARILTRRCRGEGYEATDRCQDILGRRKYYQFLRKRNQDPMSAFKHCVEFVCSGYKDPNSCIALRDELEGGPSLYSVSKHFPEACGQYPSASDRA